MCGYCGYCCTVHLPSVRKKLDDWYNVPVKTYSYTHFHYSGTVVYFVLRLWIPLSVSLWTYMILISEHNSIISVYGISDICNQLTVFLRMQFGHVLTKLFFTLIVYFG